MIVIPMLILAAVDFVTSSREAAKVSIRYLKQRENDLRTVAENPAIRDYFNNQVYGLSEEAEVYRRELKRSLQRFADRSNSMELVYPQVRFVDQQGQEVARVVKGQISSDRAQVATTLFFAVVQHKASATVPPQGSDCPRALSRVLPGGSSWQKRPEPGG